MSTVPELTVAPTEPAPSFANFAGRTAVTLGTQILAYVAGLLASAFVARALLDVAFGVFRIMQLAISYAGQSLYSGVEFGVAHYGADDDHVRDIARISLWYGTIGGLLIAILIAVGSSLPAVRTMLGVSLPWFQFAMLAIPAVVVAALARALALTRRQFIFYNALLSIDRFMFAVVAAICFIAGILDLTSALLIYVAAILVTGGVGGIYLGGIAGRARWDAAMFRRVLRYAAPLYVGQWVLPSLFAVGLVIVSMTSGTAAAGQFSVALALAQTMLFVPNAVTAVLTPDASRHEERDSSDLVAAVLRLNLYFLVILGLFLEVGATAVTVTIYGDHYREAIVLLSALIPGAVAYGATSPVWAFHALSGNAAINTRAALLGCGAQLLLLAIAIPTLGALGGALATSAAYIVVFSILLRNFTRIRGRRRTLQPTVADWLLIVGSVRRVFPPLTVKSY